MKNAHYKWVALSNTTIGMLIAVINGSIVIIALPAIFKGLKLDPLSPGNVSYLLWMLMGFLLVTAVLVVMFGRLGDIYGRTKVYNLGFVIFTLGSVLSAIVPSSGGAGAIELIASRVVTGVGGAMIMANSTAILTDAFPTEERGLALGINQVAGIAGSFIGLVLGGVLADIDWRLVFWVSVPIGVIGSLWGYRSLHDGKGSGSEGEHLDWWGTITFGVGLIAILVGITYGIQPYGGHNQGWTSRKVLTELIGGVVFLAIFYFVEQRVKQPMFDEKLFRIRAFSLGNLASLLASIARGGLQFMLIIWLQGIWLPLHGYNYSDTPLWAGIYLLPLSVGFLVAGPVSGFLSDKYGARAFATGGLLVAALSFVGLMALPSNFNYVLFALLLILNGVGMGLFAAPNTTGIMNAVPAKERGVASGMRATFMNAGSVLSIGIFFSLMIVGLSSSLPHQLDSQLQANGVSAATAQQVAAEPPTGSLFSAFLGYNPVQRMVGQQQLSQLTAQQQATLTGKEFFPHLLSKPFKDGITIVFITAAGMMLVAALASALRGGKYIHKEDEPEGEWAGDEAITPMDTGQHQSISPAPAT